MVGTALVDMYAKCGRIHVAYKFFKKMPERNVVAWNAMLSGLAMHGLGRTALDMFPQMFKEAKPDDVTYTSVLSACSHGGLVDHGCFYFSNLESLYGTTPKIEHYVKCFTFTSVTLFSFSEGNGHWHPLHILMIDPFVLRILSSNPYFSFFMILRACYQVF